MIAIVNRIWYASKGEYLDLPHDHGYQFHYNLIQDIEEIHHHLGLFSHLSHCNAKSNEEPNETYWKNARIESTEALSK